MTTEEYINEALKLCETNPRPVSPCDMVAAEQSFSYFLFHLVNIMKPSYCIEWGPGQSTNVFLKADPNVKLVSYEELQRWSDFYYKEVVDRYPTWKPRMDFRCFPREEH